MRTNSLTQTVFEINVLLRTTRMHYHWYLCNNPSILFLAAMAKCNISGDVRRSIYSTVAAVLHLGNVCFTAVEDSRGGCQVDQTAVGALEVRLSLRSL